MKLQPEDIKVLCRHSDGLDVDWAPLYERSFPANERVSIDRLQAGSASGVRRLHVTLGGADNLLCLSWIYTKFSKLLWLSYLATDPDFRSRGHGSRHLTALLETLKKEFPDRLGLLFEIEYPLPGVDESDDRVRRLNFYLGLGAKRLPSDLKYLMPSWNENEEPIRAELLWFEFSPNAVDRPTLRTTIAESYEQLYDLESSNELVTTVLSQFQT
jgi:GNAT superfamily N-acetyltransferase